MAGSPVKAVCDLTVPLSLLLVFRLGMDFSQPPQYLTGSCREYSQFPENYLKGCKW